MGAGLRRAREAARRTLRERRATCLVAGCQPHQDITGVWRCRVCFSANFSAMPSHARIVAGLNALPHTAECEVTKTLAVRTPREGECLRCTCGAVHGT